MLMTKYQNKVQEYAAKVGIYSQYGLRKALRDIVAEGTARTLWLNGANRTNDYKIIMALEKVLQVPAEKFLEE